MKKAFYLSTCSTCKKIMDQINDLDSFILQDIKTKTITLNDVEEMRKRAGSYESLFSRRAMKFRAWGLHEKELTENDYKELILKEYTFLKRPVFIVGDDIFIGNSKKTVEALLSKIN